MDSPLELLQAQHEDREAHDHLSAECPWFRHVDGGGNGDPDVHCRQAHGGRAEHEGGALVKFTPHTPEASTVVKPTVKPGGPGLFHMKGHHLPPYVEHLWFHLAPKYGKQRAYGMAVGIVKKWAQGINPGGYKTKSGKGKRTHADVRAAAQKNVAMWEKERAEAHSHHGGSEHVKAAAPALPGDRGGIFGNPMQTVHPAPPRPPAPPMPTAAEVRAVIALVPDCSDASLSATARKFLEQAAAKLERDDPLEALAVLRSAMTALYAGHKADLGDMRPSTLQADLFTRSGQGDPHTAAVKKGRDQTAAWRKAQLQLEALISRIRKRFFHGIYNGPSQVARFSEDDMTALDRFLALAAVTGKDVSEPVTSDTSGQTPLIQLPENLLNISDPKASSELASMPVLDKAKVNAYLDRARAMLGTNPAGAAQSAIRAAVIAHESGARHLARHIRQHVQALAEGGNTTKTADQASVMSAGGKSVSARNSPGPASDNPNAKLSAVDVLLAAVAGKSAGASAGHGPARSVVRQPPRPDAHQLHTEHVEHLHHLHTEHVAHLEHLHHLHVEHMEHLEHEGAERSDTAKKSAAGTAERSAASRRASATAHATAERTVASDRAARAKARSAA